MEGRELKTVDIIVPCYNEGGNIEGFIEETGNVVDCLEGYSFRYIFIDDGSDDDTLEKIRAMTEKLPVKYISFSRNFGKEAAMYAGLSASCGDFAVIMDADLQHPPKLIAEMLRTIEKTGCDSCAARRVSRKGEPRLRSLMARAFYRIMNRYSDIEIVDGAVDFRIMSRRMVDAILRMPERQRFSKGIFAWVGFETRWVEFENVRRLSGESKWSVWGLIKYALDGFIDFAVSPLKFVGFSGGIVAAGSMVYFIIEILKTIIMGKDIPGYASTICLILFFGGLITAILSLMGEYMGRMYLETKRRPLYIEKETNIDEDQRLFKP